jgi:hypothetical protein
VLTAVVARSASNETIKSALNRSGLLSVARNDVVDFLRHLAGFKVPKAFHWIDEMPTRPTLNVLMLPRLDDAGQLLL